MQAKTVDDLYNPKSAFDDRSLPEKGNPLTADNEEKLEKKAIPFIKALLDELRKKEPGLFKGDAAELVNKKWITDHTKIFNPFEGRNREEVWKELRANAKPVTREGAMCRMKEATEAKKKNK